MESIVEDIIRSGRFKRLIENILVEDAKRITGLNRVELVIIYYRNRSANPVIKIYGAFCAFYRQLLAQLPITSIICTGRRTGTR